MRHKVLIISAYAIMVLCSVTLSVGCKQGGLTEKEAFDYALARVHRFTAEQKLDVDKLGTVEIITYKDRFEEYQFQWPFYENGVEQGRIIVSVTRDHSTELSFEGELDILKVH